MKKNTLNLFYDETDSPLGKLHIAATGKGLCFISWREYAFEDFCEGLSETFNIYMNGANSFTDLAISELKSYFEGKLEQFTVSMDIIDVTPFRKNVLQKLFELPFGEIISYGDLAKEAGCPGGSRAVGSTMRINPIPVMIPCHRVVKSDGSIGSYGGGKELQYMKKFLLEHEGIDVENTFSKD